MKLWTNKYKYGDEKKNLNMTNASDYQFDTLTCTVCTQRHAGIQNRHMWITMKINNVNEGK